MDIRILPQVSREIEKEPPNLKASIFGTLERLEEGESIGPPLSKPLPSIWKGLHELRFSYQAGEYRVFYFIKVREAIYVIHGMKKKSQQLDRKTIALLQHRIRSLV